MGFALSVVVPAQIAKAWFELYAATALYPLTLLAALHAQ